MTKTVAPTACRYFGTKRIQSSSPAPMTKMAMSRITRLRLSPKKLASLSKRLNRGGLGVCILRKARRKRQIRAQGFHDRSIRVRRNRRRSSGDLLPLDADWGGRNRQRKKFPREKQALVGQLVFFQDRIKGNIFAVMPEFAVRNVK